MRIREITLRELRMKLVAPFETSSMRTDERRIVLVEADVDGITGWESAWQERTPSYSPETTETPGTFCVTIFGRWCREGI